MSETVDTIILEGIEIPAALGVTVAERRMRRPVLIDLEVERDLRISGMSDQIDDTVNYKDIFESRGYRRKPGAPLGGGFSREDCERPTREVRSARSYDRRQKAEADRWCIGSCWRPD